MLCRIFKNLFKCRMVRHVMSNPQLFTPPDPFRLPQRPHPFPGMPRRLLHPHPHPDQPHPHPYPHPHLPPRLPFLEKSKPDCSEPSRLLEVRRSPSQLPVRFLRKNPDRSVSAADRKSRIPITWLPSIFHQKVLFKLQQPAAIKIPRYRTFERRK